MAYEFSSLVRGCPSIPIKIISRKPTKTSKNSNFYEHPKYVTFELRYSYLGTTGYVVANWTSIWYHTGGSFYLDVESKGNYDIVLCFSDDCSKLDVKYFKEKFNLFDAAKRDRLLRRSHALYRKVSPRKIRVAKYYQQNWKWNYNQNVYYSSDRKLFNFTVKALFYTVRTYKSFRFWQIVTIFYFEPWNIARENVRCRIELNRGVDYRIQKYKRGNFGHLSHDFIVIKGREFADNQEIVMSKRKSVYGRIAIIVNTRSAELNISTFSYPDCGNKVNTNIEKYPQTIVLDSQSGTVYIPGNGPLFFPKTRCLALNAK